MSAPLSNRQKAYLAQLSDRAFNRLGALARGRGEAFYGGAVEALEREKFRHAEVAKACGKLGLRCCGQDEFRLVEAHFLELLGEHGAAFNSQVKAATNARRVAQWKVIEACKEFGLPIAYAAKIASSQNHGAALDDLDERALWRVVFTVRNRGRARAKEAA